MKAFLKKITTRYFRKGVTPYWMILIVDSAVVICSIIIAYIIENGFITTMNQIVDLCIANLWYLLAYIIGFRVMHTYSGVIRYSSFIDLYRIAVANIIGATIIFLLRHVTPIDTILLPLSGAVLFVSFLIATTLMWTVRIVVKYLYEICIMSNTAQKLFIYGVKEGGVALAKSIHSQESKYMLAGFVSDDPKDCHHLLMGTKIYLNDENLISVMRQKGSNTLMVSPLKTDEIRNNQAMIDSLVRAGIKILLLSEQEWDGKSDLKHARLKEVDIEDLLPRNQIEIDIESVGKILTDKCVMITGAAGSIGSEIVRQVSTFHPSQLVLIDQAETPLHEIRMMMAHKFPDIPCLTLTASVCNAKHMEVVFEQYRPEYVLHAAAYKHVPMMEDNPGEAVINNVIGTRVIADLAVKYRAKKFVMVSTDKAVNPTNVMGCSKRICEMYCQSLNNAISAGKVDGITQFVTTRFGNVLGSNGSVIPLFKEQIKNGGPVTVTHPDIIRYFMLIPEACKLVLQAGAMGNGGEIYVFDMGKPVRIANLAQRMILLSGAENIEIKYTGLREGEKLYEELLNKEENTRPSGHPKIKLATVREFDYTEVCAQIDALETITRANFDDMEIVRKMKQIVPEFKSNQSKYEELD